MRKVIPLMPSVGGSIRVVALSAHNEVLPLEERVRLMHRRRNFDLDVLVPAKVQIQTTEQ